MPTLRDFCVALLASGIVAPSTYVVVKKPAVYRSVGKPAPKVVKTRNQSIPRDRVVQTPPPEKPCIVDMPSIGLVPDLQPVVVPDLQPGGTGPWGSGPWVWVPPGGPGGGGGGSINPPAIPEPDTWAMLVFGFGFLGLSLRRRRVEA